jgi:hypothetical protein
MTDLQALTGIHNIASLRLMVEKISSAIDTYETVEHNPANSGSALAKLSDAAEELLMEVQHPLKRLFLISHQVSSRNQVLHHHEYSTTFFGHLLISSGCPSCCNESRYWDGVV